MYFMFLKSLSIKEILNIKESEFNKNDLIYLLRKSFNYEDFFQSFQLNLSLNYNRDPLLYRIYGTEFNWNLIFNCSITLNQILGFIFLNKKHYEKSYHIHNRLNQMLSELLSLNTENFLNNLKINLYRKEMKLLQVIKEKLSQREILTINYNIMNSINNQIMLLKNKINKLQSKIEGNVEIMQCYHNSMKVTKLFFLDIYPNKLMDIFLHNSKLLSMFYNEIHVNKLNKYNISLSCQSNDLLNKSLKDMNIEIFSLSIYKNNNITLFSNAITQQKIDFYIKECRRFVDSENMIILLQHNLLNNKIDQLNKRLVIIRRYIKISHSVDNELLNILFYIFHDLEEIFNILYAISDLQRKVLEKIGMQYCLDLPVREVNDEVLNEISSNVIEILSNMLT